MSWSRRFERYYRFKYGQADKDDDYVDHVWSRIRANQRLGELLEGYSYHYKNCQYEYILGNVL